jgi:TolB-like protein
MQTKFLTPLLCLVLVLTGCQHILTERNSTVISASYGAVDGLLAKQTRSPVLAANSGKRVLVATVVSLDRLDKSTTFGRLISEQMASRLAQRGISVTELKLRDSLYMNARQGELLLSRDAQNIVNNTNADFVVVGTYADAGEAVYVTVKLINPSDSTVLSAHNFSIYKSSYVAQLMK